MKSIHIRSVEMKLEPINKSVALFECGSAVTGVIHTAANEGTTVIVGGNYVLGTFECSHCALSDIFSLSLAIKSAEDNFGMNYQQYKQSISAGLYSTIH